jgi:hypothetical protein
LYTILGFELYQNITVAECPVVALWMSGMSEVVEVDPQFSVEIRMNLGKTCKRSLLKSGCRNTTITASNGPYSLLFYITHTTTRGTAAEAAIERFFT